MATQTLTNTWAEVNTSTDNTKSLLGAGLSGVNIDGGTIDGTVIGAVTRADGSFNVLAKNSGAFKIDHPLPELSESYHLVHSFTESPQADLIYSGVVELVNGRASVNIDEEAGMTEGTFEALCRNVRTFTNNETGWDNVRGYVAGNILTIECQDPDSADSVNWMVIGERKDQHMFDTDWTDDNGRVIVEPLKTIDTNPDDVSET